MNEDHEKRMKDDLTELESFLSYYIEGNECDEDIYKQIHWLEDMRFDIDRMYEKYAETRFDCRFDDYQKKLVEAFDSFTKELTENLGMSIESMFKRRTRLRDYFKKDSDSVEPKA